MTAAGKARALKRDIEKWPGVSDDLPFAVKRDVLLSVVDEAISAARYRRALVRVRAMLGLSPVHTVMRTEINKALGVSGKRRGGSNG